MQRSRMQSMATWESPVSDKLLVKKFNKRLMMSQTLLYALFSLITFYKCVD